jgi:hypothetical protein
VSRKCFPDHKRSFEWTLLLCTVTGIQLSLISNSRHSTSCRHKSFIKQSFWSIGPAWFRMNNGQTDSRGVCLCVCGGGGGGGGGTLQEACIREKGMGFFISFAVMAEDCPPLPDKINILLSESFMQSMFFPPMFSIFSRCITEAVMRIQRVHPDLWLVRYWVSVKPVRN